MAGQRAWVTPLGVLWTVKADARHAVTAYETRAEAVDAARSLLATTGGGELLIRGANGSAWVTEIVPPRGAHQ